MLSGIFFTKGILARKIIYHTTVVYCSSEETKCWWALLTDRCTAHFYPCHNYNCEIPIILFTQENNIFCYCHQSSPYYFLYNYLCKCYCHSWFCVYMRVWTRAWKVLGKGLKLILIYLQIGSSADHFLSAPLPLLPPSSTSKDSMFCWKRNFHSLDGTRRVYSSHTSSLLNLQYLYQTYYHQEKLTWLWRAWFILYRLPIEQIKFSSHKLY